MTEEGQHRSVLIGDGKQTATTSVARLQALFVSEEAADQSGLEGLLVNVTRDIGSYKVCGHSQTSMKVMAEKFWAASVKGIVDVVNDTKVLAENNPSWAVDDKPKDRTAAVAVKNFLRKAMNKISDMDLVIDMDDSGDKDRGRKAKRSRSRRRRRSKDSSSDGSSTSASERVRRRQDDATEVIARSELRVLGQQAFPDAKLVNKVVKHKVKTGSKAKAYLSAVPIEEWVPAYVGTDMQAKVRKELRANRSKGPLGSSQLIEHVVAFWATHGLTGSVSKDAVMKHVMVVLKIINTRGVAFATLYIRKLVGHIQEAWVNRDEKDCKVFDEFLKVEVTEVVSMVNNQMAKGHGKRKDDAGTKNGLPSGQKNPRPSTRANRLDYGSPFKGQEKVKREQSLDSPGKKGGRPPKGEGKNKKGSDFVDKMVCIYHDPAKGVSCKNGSQCDWEHLDTNQAVNRKKYDDSLKRFQARRSGAVV